MLNRRGFLQSSCTVPIAHGVRVRKYGSTEIRMVVRASSAPPAGTSRHRSPTPRHPPQTARGGYCTNSHSPQTCSMNRPRAAAAASPMASRDRPPGGINGAAESSNGSRGPGGASLIPPAPEPPPPNTGRDRS